MSVTGKGSRRKGPKPRLVPLINGADRRSALVYRGRGLACFDIDSVRTPDAVVSRQSAKKHRWHQPWRANCGRCFPPSLGRGPSTGICQCGSGKLTTAWCCAISARRSSTCSGMNLFAIQELLGQLLDGHDCSVISTFHATHVEDAWVTGAKPSRRPMERDWLDEMESAPGGRPIAAIWEGE